MGIKYTTYKNYEDIRVPPPEFLYLLKQKYPQQVNLDALLTPKDPQKDAQFMVAEPQQPYGNTEKCLFKDREKAERIKNDLAYIEKTDPMEYKQLTRRIMGTAEDLRFQKKNSTKRDTV